VGEDEHSDMVFYDRDQTAQQAVFRYKVRYS